MTPTKIPHLCGGILFDLLLEARKPRRKARDKRSGGTDGLAAVDVYKGLINVVTGEEMNTAGKAIEKCASNYKSCSSSKGIYVPFKEGPTQSAFDSAYKRKDPDLLKRMSGFIEKYLNEAKCEWLVRALIETMQLEHIDAEISIDYSTQLHVSSLHMAESIVFLPFLLSVLHYVIMNCPDCESGRDTFENWYTQSSPRAEWKFNSDIGSNIDPLNVSFNMTIPSQSTENATVPVYEDTDIDDRSDQQVIAEHLGKALTPLVAALEAQKAKMPDVEQMAKPLLAFSAAMKAQEHETAERIRASEKRSREEKAAVPAQDDDTSDTQHTENPDSQAQQNVKGSVTHQTIVNQYGDHPIHIDHVENLKL